MFNDKYRPSILTVIKGDGTECPLPDETLQLTVEVYDLDSEDGSGRNQNGRMFRDRIAVKRKVNASWGLLTAEEMSRIMQATEEEFFSLIYPDPVTGEGREIECYVGDRSTPLMRCNPYNVAEPLLSLKKHADENGKNYYYDLHKNLSGCLWSGLNMNFIER